MLLPMSPTDSMFLMAETREQPMHVGGLQLFAPPDGADAYDLRALFDAAAAQHEVAPLFHKLPRRSLTSFGQWGWELDDDVDLEHHVRNSALAQPGRVLELLALCSRLHSSLLDRRRPLWEMHLIEGLADGRFATYFKVHHSVVDGVSALRMLSRMLSEDPDETGMPGPWAPRMRPPREKRSGDRSPVGALRSALNVAADAAGVVPAFARTVNRGLNAETANLSFAAPRSMFNVPITGSRRFAADSWPMERLRRVGKAADATVNDVVLAMCSGALRRYLLSLDALPDEPLIAMVPVSLHAKGSGGSGPRGDGGGNAVGAVMCNLATDLTDPAKRLDTVHRSMSDGKDAMSSMTPLQILAMSALGMSPLLVWPALGLTETMRPPFNLIISNVPGPKNPLYWNGARLHGTYPLSIPLDGQALNITTTSYHDAMAFGLTGCRRSVPHLQRLLGYLDDELTGLEDAVGA